MAEFSREFFVKAFKQEVSIDGFVIRDRSIYPTQTRSSARGSDCDASLQSESGGFVTVAISHGTRTCIKRKKIHYGKFFDFCAEKCVYN